MPCSFLAPLVLVLSLTLLRLMFGDSRGPFGLVHIQKKLHQYWKNRFLKMVVPNAQSSHFYGVWERWLVDSVIPNSCSLLLVSLRKWMSYLGWIERSFFKYVSSCPLGIAIFLVDPISIYFCEFFETTTKIISKRPEEFFFISVI